MESVKYIAAALVSSALSYSLHANAQIPENKSTDNQLEEVIVIGDRKGDFTIITENAQKLVDVPGALGDPLSAVLSLPGVVPSGDGGEPAVRGSSPADNLYMVDFLPAGYVFHNFSASIFSEYVLQDFQLYASGFGPSYGNVTGATFDITLRDPKNQEFGGTADISLLRSGIFLESGLTENSAFYVSARKSFIHLLIKEQTPEEAAEDSENKGIRIIEAPQDEDYQFKYLWDITENNKLTVSANGATDLVEAELTPEADFIASNPDFAGDAKIAQTYNGQSLTYEHQNGNIQSFKAALGRSSLGNETFWGQDYSSLFDIERTLAKTEFNYQLTSNHLITTGAQLTHGDYTLDYRGIVLSCTEEIECDGAKRIFVADKNTINIKETVIYLNDSWAMNARTRLDIGAQWYKNDSTDEGLGLPRAALGYQATQNIELTARYGQYARLPEIEYSLPGIGNPNLPTAKSTHNAIGIKQDLNNGWSWNLEIYHKTLDDLAVAANANSADANLLYTNAATGKAQGVDILINKDITQKWYGWLALSYGKSERTNFQTGNTTDYYLDTPWLATWVMNYEIRDSMDLGLRWNLRTGAAYTPIVGLKDNPDFADSVLPVYGEAYSQRLPLYNRLDIRYKWDFNIGHYPSALIVDIINILNRENIESRNLDYSKVDNKDSPIITEDSAGLGILPTIGFRISF